MTILDRYISREFIKIFLLVIASFLSLYLIIDFWMFHLAEMPVLANQPNADLPRGFIIVRV
jgi:hypothetical protein